MERIARVFGVLSVVGASLLTAGSAHADSSVTGLVVSVSRFSDHGSVKIGSTSASWAAGGSCGAWFTAADVQTLASAGETGTTVTMYYNCVGGQICVMCITGYEVKP